MKPKLAGNALLPSAAVSCATFLAAVSPAVNWCKFPPGEASSHTAVCVRVRVRTVYLIDVIQYLQHRQDAGADEQTHLPADVA